MYVYDGRCRRGNLWIKEGAVDNQSGNLWASNPLFGQRAVVGQSPLIPSCRTLTPGADAVPSPAERARVNRYSREIEGKGNQKWSGDAASSFYSVPAWRFRYSRIASRSSEVRGGIPAW